ncbi:MAG: GNAT family N-acetyltransferase [Candidatus Lokiarchaeota archaeon]|nr:GNAT family N-acetyltransferase [Candidatus Lokiarchaeota archaeon]
MTQKISTKQSMNNDLGNLFKLTQDHVKEACKVAGSAFKDDPVTIFTYPDEGERKQKLQYGFYMIYNYGIKYGLTYATSKNLEGITIWLPPNKTYPSTWTMMRHGGFYSMRKVGLKIKALKITMTIFKYEDERHKELVPYEHWYFQNIAVKPEEQGKGYGGLLISTMIKNIESDGLPIYVESNTEKNVSIYQKYGFEILEHTIIPETDVPLWCMLRKPR